MHSPTIAPGVDARPAQEPRREVGADVELQIGHPPAVVDDRHGLRVGRGAGLEELVGEQVVAVLDVVVGPADEPGGAPPRS